MYHFATIPPKLAVGHERDKPFVQTHTVESFQFRCLKYDELMACFPIPLFKYLRLYEDEITGTLTVPSNSTISYRGNHSPHPACVEHQTYSFHLFFFTSRRKTRVCKIDGYTLAYNKTENCKKQFKLCRFFWLQGITGGEHTQTVLYI